MLDGAGAAAQAADLGDLGGREHQARGGGEESGARARRRRFPKRRTVKLEEAAAAARDEQGAGDAALAEQGGHAVEGEVFADGTEIERDGSVEHPHGEALGIEEEAAARGDL